MSRKSKCLRGNRTITLKIFSFMFLIILLSIPSSYAAMNSYMSINSQDLGDIDGDSTLPGREGMHTVHEIQHEIEVPLDSHTGLPTGQAIHKSFVVTTKLNKGTPKLYEMLITGDTAEITIDYYRIDQQGREELYFSVTLENAMISEIQHNKPDVLNENNKSYGDMVSLSFNYSSITWTYQPDGISYSSSR